MNGSLLHLEEERKELDHRLTVIESNPQEVLIKQVDTIHNEVCDNGGGGGDDGGGGVGWWRW